MCGGFVASIFISASFSFNLWTAILGLAASAIMVLMRAHGGPVKCIVSTLDDENDGMLFTGGLDGAVKLWCISVKQRRRPLTAVDSGYNN